MEFKEETSENNSIKSGEEPKEVSEQSLDKITGENADCNGEKIEGDSHDATELHIKEEVLAGQVKDNYIDDNTSKDDIGGNEKETAEETHDSDGVNEDEDEELPEQVDVADEVTGSETPVSLPHEESTAGSNAPSTSSNKEEKSDCLDILGNGQLKKKVLKKGLEGSPHPATGQEVSVKTEGTLENGLQVDVFEEKTFILGDGDVVTAWDLCVPTMFQGEVCELITAPRFAYGSLGREDDDGDVPPDSQITYIIQLLSIKPGPDISALTDEQRIELGDQKRERGNELFRREDYSQAVYSYSRALKYLEPSASEEAVQLKVKCWNNIGASHLKVREYAAAKNACDAVLQVDPENVKALFRKGKVLVAQGECEEALDLLKKANSLEPDNKLVRRELLLARQKYGEDIQKERSMYQKMVGGLGDSSKRENTNSFFTWPVILGIAGVAMGGIAVALLLAKH